MQKKSRDQQLVEAAAMAAWEKSAQGFNAEHGADGIPMAQDDYDAIIASVPAPEPVGWMQSKPREGECVKGAEYSIITDAWKKSLVERAGDSLDHKHMVEYAHSHDVPLCAASISAKPVNAKLLEALKDIEAWTDSDHIKQICRKAQEGAKP